MSQKSQTVNSKEGDRYEELYIKKGRVEGTTFAHAPLPELHLMPVPFSTVLSFVPETLKHKITVGPSAVARKSFSRKKKKKKKRKHERVERAGHIRTHKKR